MNQFDPKTSIGIEMILFYRQKNLDEKTAISNFIK